MDNFMIAVPSRGRVTSSTLSYLKVVLKNTDIPLHIYVDEDEIDAYEEFYPNFTIVPHDKHSIGAIRRLIQDDAAALNKTVFMLDDDTSGFFDESGTHSVSFRSILSDIQVLLEEYSFDVAGLMLLSAASSSDSLNLWPSHNLLFGVGVVLTPQLHAKGIRYSEDEDLSEDYDFSIQLGLHNDVRKVTLPSWVRFSYGGADSHFGQAFYTRSCIALYKKYGNIMELCLNVGDLFPSIDADNFESYKEHGVTYSKGANNMLVNLYKTGLFWDKDFLLDAMEVCHCKKTPDGDFTYDWDYDGYDGSTGTNEAWKRGHNTPWNSSGANSPSTNEDSEPETEPSEDPEIEPDAEE